MLGQLEHVWRDFHVRHVVEIILGVADLIRISQRRAHQPLLPGLEHDHALPLRQHDASERHHGFAAHCFADDRKRFLTDRITRSNVRQLNKKTGNRLRQQLVDDVTREPVEAADKGRGYEYAKNSYLSVEDEEIESIEVESNHMIEIDSFVPRSEIDERYLDSPYYIGPNDPVGQEAFAVIREAMRGKDMVALGRVVLAKRERVIMLQPWEKGLLGTTLRYPYEVRDSKDYFYDIPDVKIAPDMLTLAEHILKSKETKFDPSIFVDRYEQAVLQLLEKKQQGIPAPKTAPFVAPTNVINLMDTLRRSRAPR